MKHYIYKITNNKPTDKRLYYIGVKSSSDPDNDNYYGSSEYLNEAINEIGLKHFSKEILSTWDTREEANAEEVRIHCEIDVAADEEYYNMANATSTGFCTHGMVPIRDTRDGSTKNVSKEDFEKFDYFISNSYGWVSVVDTRSNISTRVLKEDFEKFDYYVSINDGLVSVIDTRDGSSKKVSTDDYKKYDYFVNHTTGHLSVIDTRDNKTKRVTIDDFNKFDYYISTTKGSVTVYDKKLKINKRVSKEDFEKNDNYESIMKNSVLIKDTRTGISKRVSKEEFEKNKYYQAPTKGQVTVRDIRDMSTKNVNKEEFEKNDFLITVSSKIIKIFDKNSKLKHTIYGNFRKNCTKLKLPSKIFETSYKNNSKPIENHKKYTGWYAKEVK